MAPVSIFKKPGAQKFQLVHRSQRDEGRDPSKDEGVLKRVGKDREGSGGGSKGKGKANAGDAANFGIYYDDTEYDYTQHLRTIGGQDAFGDELDSVMIAAPQPQDAKAAKRGFMLKQQQEQEDKEKAMLKAYESQTAIPLELQGFNPDMDPALRQTLEALEDDAYLGEDPGDFDEAEAVDAADEGEDEEWFDDLVGGGIRANDEIVDFGPDEQEDPAITARKEREKEEYETAKANGEDLTPYHTEDWMQKFREFKLANKDKASPPASDDLPSDADEMEEMTDYGSEGADTVGSLRTGIGAARTRRKLRKAGSDASGYSMSSSSMFRNDGLQSLDAQFDRIEEEYNSEDDDDDEEDEDDFDPTSELNVNSREDFDTILDEFLDKYEVIGGKVKQKLEGDTAADKLNTMRLAMADLAPKGEQLKKHEDAASKRITSAYRIAEGEEEEDDSTMPMPYDIDAKEDRMDAQTILSTYTNTENHPTKIRSQDLLNRKKKKSAGASKGPEKHVAFAEKEDVAPIKKVQIVVDPKTGFPMEIAEGEESEESEDEEDKPRRPKKQTITRDRNESKEDKKARKQAAKSEKQNRRVEKKETKEAFASERKSQLSQTANAKQREDVQASMKL